MKPVNKMTVRELKTEIRSKTHIINERLKQFYDDGNENLMINSQISKLREMGATGRKGDYIGLGFEGKTKRELIRQYRELQYFEQWDIYSEQGQRALELRERNAWESFNQKTQGAFTYQEWRDLVEDFNAIGDTLLEQFGSENVQNAYRDAEAGERVNLLKYMLEINKDTNYKGATKNQKVDRLRELLKSKLN